MIKHYFVVELFWTWWYLIRSNSHHNQWKLEFTLATLSRSWKSLYKRNVL